MAASNLQPPSAATTDSDLAGTEIGRNDATLWQLVIVAETLLYREGLVELLGRDSRLKVVAAVANADAAVETVTHVGPDAVLLDIGVEGGLAAMATMRRTAPEVRVVAFGVAESEQTIVEWAEAGAAGYVPREATVAELVTVVEAAMRDEVVCSSRVAGTLLRRVGALASERRSNGQARRLTPRETQVVGLIDEGLSNKEIATRLQIELPTVKNHIHSILEKLGVHRRAEAAARVRALRTTGQARLERSGSPSLQG